MNGWAEHRCPAFAWQAQDGATGHVLAAPAGVETGAPVLTVEPVRGGSGVRGCQTSWANAVCPGTETLSTTAHSDTSHFIWTSLSEPVKGPGVEIVQGLQRKSRFRKTLATSRRFTLGMSFFSIGQPTRLR